MKYSKILVSIGTEKIEECVAFYQKLFGYQPRVYKKSVYSEFDFQGLTLAIYKPRSADEENLSNSNKSNGLSICLQVENLESVIVELKNLGDPLISQIKEDSNMKEIYIYDPGGNRIIFYQYK